MKVSIEQMARFNSLTNVFIETFSLSPKDKRIVEDFRSIKTLFNHIAESYSEFDINYLEGKKVSDFLITKTFKNHQTEKTITSRIFEFNYMPIVSKYNCSNCSYHGKKQICLLRMKKTKEFKNCIYYLEKLHINNIKVIENN